MSDHVHAAARVGLTGALSDRSERTFVLCLCFGLVALVWLVFAQTARHDFVNYDDDIYVYANPRITGGLNFENAAWAFTHSHARNWHPLTTISHMLDSQVFGRNAGGPHMVNVALHTATVLLLFQFLRLTTDSLWRSACVAALFAIHPLRVESVAWIAERKDVLSGVFFMLTLLAYWHYTRRPGWVRYVFMLAAFAGGLMSKPMLVTLPCVLLLLDYWPLGRLDQFRLTSRLLLEKLPLFFLSMGASAVTFFIQKTGPAQSAAIPFGWRLGDALLGVCAYLRRMVWPLDLAPFYPRAPHPPALWQSMGAALFLLAITVAAVTTRRARPYFSPVGFGTSACSFP